MLLDEVTALRTNAISADAQLEGWSALVRDILFYGFLHGRQQALLDHFAASLRSSIGEVDGKTLVDVLLKDVEKRLRSMEGVMTVSIDAGGVEKGVSIGSIPSPAAPSSGDLPRCCEI